uniref:Uncharacterized protein n=1 Tax=Picea glauca TaxID=3330 RepID=A0A117NG98_PICGL|nr:hypothetical protein ABT39_MTgene1532 [Picea glauca]
MAKLLKLPKEIIGMPLLGRERTGFFRYHHNQRAAPAGDVCSAKEARTVSLRRKGHVEPLAISRWCLNRDFQ